MQAKSDRSIPMLGRLARERPEDPHAAFFLCKTHLVAGDTAKAVTWGWRCAELAGEKPQYAIFWVWLFRAAFIEGGPDAAEEVLRRAGERHAGLADLRHCRMMMEAYRWLEAARTPGVYAHSPQASIRYVQNLPAASQLLGLPFLFERSPRAGQS